jgi:hypothetical protein
VADGFVFTGGRKCKNKFTGFEPTPVRTAHFTAALHKKLARRGRLRGLIGGIG